VTLLLAVAAALCGLVIGSFLNVVIHRVPLRQSVVTPRSACPSCGTTLAERDNIPGALLGAPQGAVPHLHGADLRPIPARRARHRRALRRSCPRLGADWALPAFCLFFAALLAVALIDLEHFIVPNRIVFPMLAVLVAAPRRSGSAAG
jgi:leader peptidase (prepilin peptidase)/N-methyltransferase